MKTGSLALRSCAARGPVRYAHHGWTLAGHAAPGADGSENPEGAMEVVLRQAEAKGRVQGHVAGRGRD
jgi:hypothetical protein